MVLKFRLPQSPVEIVDIRNWRRDDEFEIFPVGSRAKRALFSPAEPGGEFLVPNHRYLFKEAIPRHPVQFWSELMAYEVGRLMNVLVPPAHLAIDSESRTPGALIEFYYGHPGIPQDQRYVA